MVIIRLSRGGTKKRPFYHIIVTDNRHARDGSFIERIGFFNPIVSGKSQMLSFNRDRIQYWMNCGAKLSKRVTSLIKSANQKNKDDSTLSK